MPMRTVRSTRVRLAGMVATAAVLLSAALALACGGYEGGPTALARRAVSEDPHEARAAIAALRAKGPAGLGEILASFGHEARAGDALAGVDPADQARAAAAVDAVAAQKDAAYSGLYWYTDFDGAKAAAKAQGKPILSLRLLGNLDTDFSCANSRFFRTVLYANREVAAALRDRFVLHWKSVRPVPTVTIDMGDGRVIRRTVTGNSIHYVLDAEGRTVDALPGLYGPGAFLRGLGEAEKIERELRKYGSGSGSGGASARAIRLSQWHAARKSALEAAWENDLKALGFAAPALTTTAAPAPAGPGGSLPAVAAAPGAAPARPTALSAARLAGSKSSVELGLVVALDPAARTRALESATDEQTWKKIAALPAHAAEARLDENSRALVRAKQEGAAAAKGKRRAEGPSAFDASRLAVGKRVQEDPVLRLVRNFERSVAEDAVRNEYTFHSKINEWFAARLPEALDGAGPDRLNDKVYAELFLTPGDDPWLGLAPEDAYSALEGAGVR